MRDGLHRLVPVAFVEETGAESQLGVLSKFLVELVVELPLRRDVVFEEHVARMNEWSVAASRVAFSRSLELGDFGIRHVTHHLRAGADCVEGPQQLFRIFGGSVVDE